MSIGWLSCLLFAISKLRIVMNYGFENCVFKRNESFSNICPSLSSLCHFVAWCQQWKNRAHRPSNELKDSICCWFLQYVMAFWLWYYETSLKFFCIFPNFDVFLLTCHIITIVIILKTRQECWMKRQLNSFSIFFEKIIILAFETVFSQNLIVLYDFWLYLFIL